MTSRSRQVRVGTRRPGDARGTSQIEIDGALVKSEAKMTMQLKSKPLTYDADGTLTCQRL